MDEGYFLDLIRSNPKEKMNYDSLGKYYLNNSQFLEASELYEYLTRAHPEEASFWARLAFSLSNISKFEDAVVAYEKCLYLEEPTSTRFYNLALCLKQTGRTSDAFATAKKAWEMSREEDVRLLLEELSLELNSAKTTTPEVKQRMVVNRVVKAANLEKPVEEETVVSKKTLKPRIKQVTNPSEPVVVPRTRVPAEKAYYKGKKSYFELESSSVKPTMKSRISGKEPAGNDAPETVTTKASKKKVLAPTEN
jgi:tetratricopeptide (TPR) repeat protein